MEGYHKVKILVQGQSQFAEEFAKCIEEELDKNYAFKKRSDDKILMTESDGRKTCTIIYNFAEPKKK